MGGVLNVTDFLEARTISAFQLRVAALCAVVIGLDGFDSQSLAFVAPAISREWHLLPGALGSVFGAALFGMLIGAILLGSLADYFGRKPMILLGTVIFGLGALSTLAVQALPDLMIIRFLTGIGLGGVLPNAVALTSEYGSRKHRTMMVMVMFSAITVGSALGGVLATQLIPPFGWKAVFVAGGVMPLLIVPAIVIWLPELLEVLVARGARARITSILRKIEPKIDQDADYASSAEKISGFVLPQLFRQNRALVTILFWAIFFLNLLDIYFLNSWLPTLFNATGLSDSMAIIITVMFQAGGAIGSFILGWLIARLGFFPVLGTSFVVGCCAILALGWAGAETALLIPAAFLAGACVIGGQGGCNAMAARFYPAFVRSTGVGWALGIGRIGSIVGPVLGGFMLAAHWAVPSVFTAGALPQLGGALFIGAIGLLTGWRLAHKEV